MPPSVDVGPLLRSLQREARELWVCSNVPRLPFPPVAIEFLRDYVQCNSPVIFTNVPTPVWSRSRVALERAAGDHCVTINWTPNGKGDDVHPVQTNDKCSETELLFVKPHQTSSSLAAFLSALCDGGAEGLDHVPYYSQQNDCLRCELPGLVRDLPDMRFAAEAFGGQPDAVNLWVGDSRAVSSMHKDPYENLFLVTAGKKIFTLRPPCDVSLLEERRVRAATYAEDGAGQLQPKIDDPEAYVSWIVGEPLDESVATPVVCEVTAGEMLYLPAYWYHRVEQRGLTVGIKYVGYAPKIAGFPARETFC